MVAFSKKLPEVCRAFNVSRAVPPALAAASRDFESVAAASRQCRGSRVMRAVDEREGSLGYVRRALVHRQPPGDRASPLSCFLTGKHEPSYAPARATTRERREDCRETRRASGIAAQTVRRSARGLTRVRSARGGRGCGRKTLAGERPRNGIA